MDPRIAANFSPTSLRELRDLDHESDAQIREEGLWNLAQRLEQDDRAEGAVELYRELATGDRLPRFAERAQKRLETLQGRGEFGARAELFLRRVARDATSPSAIVAMGAGSLAFRLTRLAILGRLASSPTAGFFTRGLGLRFAASLGAFGVETGAFTLAGKATASLLGERVDWSSGALRRDWLSGALVLGSLKGAGALTQRGLNRWASGNSSGEWITQQLAPNLAMFGGILFGQGLERRLGLRAPGRNSDALLDGLTTLLHFKVGSAVAGNILGNNFLHFERRMDAASELQIATMPPRINAGPSFAMAGLNIPMRATETADPPWRSHIFLSENKGPGVNEPFDPRTLRSEGGRIEVSELPADAIPPKTEASPPPGKEEPTNPDIPTARSARPTGGTIPPAGSLTTLAGLGTFLRSPTDSPMTPDQALETLLSGNRRFMSGRRLYPNQEAAHRQALVAGQAPFAAILGCVDSRVPTDLIFDQGLGDLFVARVAGNYVDEAVLGSLEYGVGVVRIPLVVVLGHEGCGMVRAAIAEQPLPGKIEALAQGIREVLQGQVCEVQDRQTWAARANVRAMVQRLRNSPEVLGPIHQAGKVRIVGAYYHLASGHVEVMEP